MDKLLDFLIAICKLILLAMDKLDKKRAEKFRADLAANPTASLFDQLNPSGSRDTVSATSHKPESSNP